MPKVIMVRKPLMRNATNKLSTMPGILSIRSGHRPKLSRLGSVASHGAATVYNRSATGSFV